MCCFVWGSDAPLTNLSYSSERSEVVKGQSLDLGSPRCVSRSRSRSPLASLVRAVALASHLAAASHVASGSCPAFVSPSSASVVPHVASRAPVFLVGFPGLPPRPFACASKGRLRRVSSLSHQCGVSDGRQAHTWPVSPAVQFLSLILISEPTRLRRISYAVFCLKKKKKKQQHLHLYPSHFLEPTLTHKQQIVPQCVQYTLTTHLS